MLQIRSAWQQAFTVSFIPSFFWVIIFNIFAAAGEEFDWRDSFVPKHGRWMGFMNHTPISTAICQSSTRHLAFPRTAFETSGGRIVK